MRDFKKAKIKTSKVFKASDRIKKRNDTRKLVLRSVKFFILIFVFMAPILVLRADFLQIKNIVILGDETGEKDYLKSEIQNFISGKILWFLPKSNLMLIDENDLASALLSKFSNLEEVDIHRRLDMTLEVSATERSSDYLWCSNTQECFNMTKNGLVFEKSILPRSNQKLIFKGVIVQNPILQSFATKEVMQKYENLVGVLQKEGLKVSVVNVDSQNKIIVGTDIGDIFFNGEEKDLAPAIESALTLINDIRSKTPSATFQYIDVRFGNKVYYKMH